MSVDSSSHKKPGWTTDLQDWDDDRCITSVVVKVRLPNAAKEGLNEGIKVDLRSLGSSMLACSCLSFSAEHFTSLVYCSGLCDIFLYALSCHLSSHFLLFSKLESYLEATTAFVGPRLVPKLLPIADAM